MNNIRISIIIPVYNTSKFLEKCLKSIIEQNFKEIEIICVNDGSTDNSLEILEKLQKKDNRIIIINKENGGLTSARNAGLKEAKGKYCLNIDSDDWIEQGYLKTLYERAEKDDLDITLSNIIFDYLDEPQKNYILNDLKISNTEIITGDEYINVFLKENFYGYTWNKLIKTELYKKNNIKYNEDIFMLEDVEIILRLSKFAKKIGKINKAFYHYVQHKLNGSSKISLKRLKDIEICFSSLKNNFFYDSDVVFNISNRESIVFMGLLKSSFILHKNLEYQKILKSFLKKNKKLPYLKNNIKKINLDIIYCNLLKIFPYMIVINFLFIFDNSIIEKVRKFKNK